MSDDIEEDFIPGEFYTTDYSALFREYCKIEGGAYTQLSDAVYFFKPLMFVTHKIIHGEDFWMFMLNGEYIYTTDINRFSKFSNSRKFFKRIYYDNKDT